MTVGNPDAVVDFWNNRTLTRSRERAVVAVSIIFPALRSSSTLQF